MCESNQLYYILSTAIGLEFDQTMYMITEGEGDLQVCAVLEDLMEPLGTEVWVGIHSKNGSALGKAGMPKYMTYVVVSLH